MACFHSMTAGALALGLALPMPAIAADTAPAAVVVTTDSQPVADMVAPSADAPAPFAGASVIDDGALAAVAGKADMQLLEQIVNAQNTGTVTGNTINGNFTTGMISIDGGSFDNFNGMALMSVNTGNNVSINSSMSVNVAFQH